VRVRTMTASKPIASHNDFLFSANMYNSLFE
jgi:hypothetical protein